MGPASAGGWTITRPPKLSDTNETAILDWGAGNPGQNLNKQTNDDMK